MAPGYCKERRTSFCMSTISNRYADVEMWNVNPGTGSRGPFVIVQCGAAHGDELSNEQMFLLRRDGKWVNILCFDSTAGQSRWPDEMIFETPQELLQVLSQLQATPEVVELPFTSEGWRCWIS